MNGSDKILTLIEKERQLIDEDCHRQSREFNAPPEGTMEGGGERGEDVCRGNGSVKRWTMMKSSMRVIVMSISNDLCKDEGVFIWA